MSYVDGFIVPVPKTKIDAYRRLSELSCDVWMEHGALEYQEYIADDVPEGVMTSFPLSVKLQEDETVVFAWARYESRQHRDTVVKKVMADKRMEAMKPENLPFDGQRLIWGGFNLLVSNES